MAGAEKVSKRDRGPTAAKGEPSHVRTGGVGRMMSGGDAGAYLAHLQRTAGNRVVVGLLARSVPAVQRHFVKDEVHAPPQPKHVHTAPMAGEQLDPLVTGYAAEVEGLLKQGNAGEVERLKKILEVLESYRKVVPDSGKKKERLAKIDAIMVRVKGPVEEWERKGAQREQESVGRFEDPALKALVKLESLALDVARHAELTVKAALSATSASDVEKPATDASKGLVEARSEQETIARLAASLTEEAGGSTAVKTKVEAFGKAAGRAFDHATRMADLASAVLKRWQVVDSRRKQAVTAIDRAKADVSRLEDELDEADTLVRHHEGYIPNLLYDVRQWARDPTADLGALKEIVDEARLAQIVAIHDRDRLDLALDRARDTLALTTRDETAAAQNAEEGARSAAMARGAEAAAGVGEAQDLTALRKLAGGVEPADLLLTALDDPKRLIGLIKALGLAKARAWVLGKDVGPALATSMLEAFGEDGLGDLSSGIEAGKLLVLLKGIGPARLAELVSDVGLKAIADLCGSFIPTEIEDYVKALGASRLVKLLDDVKAAALKSLSLDLSALSALVAEVSGADLAALIAELGATRAKALVESFAPAVLKGVLVDLRPSAIAILDANPAYLKAILKDFTGKEIADLGLTASQFKIVLASLSAAEVKTLATDITPVRVRQLVGAFPKGPELMGLLGDLSNPGHTILANLFTRFSAAELKVFRSTVGNIKFKDIVVTKGLGASALEEYGADWLKRFVGAGPKAWAHVTTAKISKKTGQISGGHDETVFTNFIAGPATGYPAGTPRARLTNPGTPGPIYDVSYRTAAGITGVKTLVQGLTAAENSWRARFNEAVWHAVNGRNLPKGGGAYTGNDVGGQRFDGFYKAGKDQVDTIWPVV